MSDSKMVKLIGPCMDLDWPKDTAFTVVLKKDYDSKVKELETVKVNLGAKLIDYDVRLSDALAEIDKLKGLTSAFECKNCNAGTMNATGIKMREEIKSLKSKLEVTEPEKETKPVEKVVKPKKTSKKAKEKV
jgi:hypothetical protein